MKTAITTALLLVSLPTLAAQPACMDYGSEARLSGRLSRHTFAGPPNYESVAQGDRPETYYFITPAKPACVDAGRDAQEPPVPRTGKIQLIFTNEPQTAYRQLRPLLNTQVQCTGAPMHSMSGHHHSDILLSDAHCQAAGKP